MKRRVRSLRGGKSKDRDRGVALPEVLIGVVMTGLLTASLSFALVVVLRQSDNSEGRLNNARSENGVGTWLPADLASANSDGVNVEPGASPCGAVCPVNAQVGGSNALMLSWTTLEPNGSGTATITVLTNVSYRYVLVGDEYQLIRVECKSINNGAFSCRTNVVLHELDPPPGGSPFTPGTDAPTWVMTVSRPPQADAIDPNAAGVDPGLQTKNAQKVTVTINGGGDGAGAGGGTSQITLSAGGTNRELIDATSLQGAPSLIAARSRCGGAIALVVDESGSIGSTALGQVKIAVKDFIAMFAGTPIKLMIVRFSTVANTFTETGGWSQYYDMLKDSEVTALRTKVDSLTSSGSTNWEDAMFRTFYQSNGDYQSIIPKTVVFFTDGVPTRSRVNATSATAGTNPPARLVNYPAVNGGDYNQEAFYRANLIAKTFRDVTTFIGVGVGPDINDNQAWLSDGAGWHYSYTRSFYYPTYYRWYHIERGFRYRSADTQRGYHLERRAGTSPNYTWSVDTGATSTTPLGTSSGITRRVSFTAPYLLWQTSTSPSPVTAYSNSAQPVANNATSWGTTVSGTTNLVILRQENNLALAESDGSDGWKAIKTYSGTLTEWEVDSAATSPLSDGTKRIVFSAPYLHSRTYLVNHLISQNQMNANPIADGAFSLTSYNTGTTNTALYTSQNQPVQGTSYKDDGWSSLSTPKTTSATSSSYFIDTEVTDLAGYNAASSTVTGARSRTKVYSEPYDFLDAPVSTNKSSDKIIAQLIAGNDNAERAEDLDNDGVYDNPKQANLYISPDWSKFGAALRSVALAECGGTLTLQTKVGGVAAADPFTYQKTKVFDYLGAPLTSDMTIVTTTRAFPSGTFGLDLDLGKAVTLEIQPQNLSDLTAYSPAGWSCKVGLNARSFTVVPILDSVWTGIRVSVGANEAVSCVLSVTR